MSDPGSGARNNLMDTFAGAADARKFLESEYATYRNALTDLGLVRGSTPR
jgi:hypothetical protein